MKIKEAVQIFNVINQAVELNNGIVPGGFEWAHGQLRKEMMALQEHAKTAGKDVNKFIDEVGDKPSQVFISLSVKDLPEKTPSGLTSILDPVMEQPDFKKDYYSKLLDTKKKEK